ncbi:fimbrial protein [Proteus myxofaciens]|uniref:Fimbrial-type adhesion domain-containing protein n=1 Tax=Proteus myxofaciens ATCC 19692 TaxID=1354337 RepID=A0A198GQ90_9GAMM|nr:fimbrial protein [Proteus myxofaciens]OAT39035.1 hypothetical protein M983_0130 [Proteus myxofaciens ATCC 19692]
MKKSLFSLLILSTMSLSNQAIALSELVHDHLILNEKTISIQGKVLKKDPTCTLENIAPISLDDVYDEDISQANAKEFSIKFSNCTNSDVYNEISIVLNEEATPDLKNINKNDDASNVSIQLFDEENYPILLNKKSNLTMKKEVVNGNAEFILKANYKKPENEAIKPGQIVSNLTFKAYINDDISLYE